MTQSHPFARCRRYAGALLLGVALAGLVSCSSKAPEPVPPIASAATPMPSRIPSPLPSLPVPADGVDLQSCADGNCEVRVTGPTTVPLPARFGVGPIEVTAIDAETVRMVVPLNGPNFSSDGGCSPLITGQGAGVSAHVDLTCRAGEKTSLNDMALEVVGIVDGSAVVRIRPAT